MPSRPAQRGGRARRWCVPEAGAGSPSALVAEVAPASEPVRRRTGWSRAVRHRVQAGALLDVALHDVPGRLGDICVHHHLVLGAGVVLPAGDGLEVHRRQLPLPHGVLQAGPEAALLLAVADREPVLAQHDPVLDEQALEPRTLVEEAGVLRRSAEAHHRLHPGAVVPGRVEEHDLAGTWQLLDVALEVPLPFLSPGRRRERDDPCDPGTEVLGDPLDRPALAGGVAAFEDNNDALAFGLDPLLDLDQLRLQPEQLGFVDRRRHPLSRSPGSVLGHVGQPNETRRPLELCRAPQVGSGVSSIRRRCSSVVSTWIDRVSSVLVLSSSSCSTKSWSAFACWKAA